ncbi:hypothetical protein F511_27815 [Dorcoceras hygrometricum]|uniref:Uncharacterized protein n=1 Tax=Dorcoceras hygrometricum TaxID=472368 RepID=A0A2Z7CSH2_9LAMI|nr:hypothetical protein F511_27815 [Dorcoceras hygrometricum]
MVQVRQLENEQKVKIESAAGWPEQDLEDKIHRSAAGETPDGGGGRHCTACGSRPQRRAIRGAQPRACCPIHRATSAHDQWATAGHQVAIARPTHDLILAIMRPARHCAHGGADTCGGAGQPCAWLRPVSQETGTSKARSDYPRQYDWNKSDHGGGGTWRWRGGQRRRTVVSEAA